MLKTQQFALVQRFSTSLYGQGFFVNLKNLILPSIWIREKTWDFRMGFNQQMWERQQIGEKKLLNSKHWSIL